VARVGFIGLGIMGSRMAANLARAGHALTVFNRTRERAEAWVAEHGGAVAATPAVVGADSDVVVTMVVDGAQVEDVLLGDDGAARGARAKTLFVDMSTIAPRQARATASALAELGMRFVDAPVTGSAPRADEGTLTIMAGGAAEDVERARPLLDTMGSLVLHVGDVGQGQMLKLVNNAVAAANAAVLAQALVVARATGVDLEALVEVMRAGSGGSAMLDLKAQPMLRHDFSTLFKLGHMLKDVDLCLEAGREAGVPFPAAAATREALVAAMGRGHADDDFAAVLEVFEGLSGVRV
jgi:3-hydroxyisobutyrate dehydrogenase-like beta-hydroxyacid dehydrogenase